MVADQNIRFLVHLKSLGENPTGYRAAHVHVSALPAGKKSRNNLSRAISVLADLKNRYKTGDIFLLRNADVMFIAKGIPMAVLKSSCQEIEEAFVGDAGVDLVNAHGGSESYTLFDLERDHKALMEWAEKAAGLAQAAAGPVSEPKGDIDLALLGRIKDELAKIDISTMLFNQPVYEVLGHEAEVMFHEMYVSVQVMEEMFCPGLSLTSKRWLFTDLTEDLDGAVLRFLADLDTKAGAKRMSINVNLSSLASAKFVKFDADIPTIRRQNVILEINKTDLFENMRLFRELAPYLRQRGYRLLLDGLSFLNVLAIDFTGIECDFAKVFWSGEIAQMEDSVLERIATKFRRREGPRFLLARCDSAESVRFARAVGINLVQGRLVDHMVRRKIPF